LGMQGDVAVGAQFPDRHVQPVRGPDLHVGRWPLGRRRERRGCS
jgi:hypothetical protein